MTWCAHGGIFPRPLFTIILGQKYSTGQTKVQFVMYWVLNHKTTKITMFYYYIRNMAFYSQTESYFAMKDEKVSDIYWTKSINTSNSVEAPLRFLILTLSHVNGK